MDAKNMAMTGTQIWWLAARPRTLPISVAPVIVGSAIAFYAGKFALLPAIATLIAALLLQIGANLANDVFDFQRGADTEQRTGPLRVTQAGLLTPSQVKAGMWVVFGIAGLLGLYLAWQSNWFILLLGLLAIVAAIAYTAGPFPLGYHGLGEVFVFIFFGLVAVTGTYYVQAKEISVYALSAAIPIGLLASAVLTVNNLRDVNTDRASGKMTLAARYGESWARQEYIILIALAYLTVFLLALTYMIEPWVVITWLSAPLIFPIGRTVYSLHGRPLNKALAQTGQLELVFALLFSLGMILAKYFR